MTYRLAFAAWLFMATVLCVWAVTLLLVFTGNLA